MPWWFDFAVTSLVDDGRTVRTEFRNGPRPGPGTSRAQARRMWAQGSSAGVLTISYGSEATSPGLPTTVQLELASGITPSFLARFSWAKWLTAADEFVRSGTIEDPAASRELGAAMQSVVGRPGRAGHVPGFLEAIASRYRQIRAEGDPAPVKRIAEERSVSRNTAAGWLKQARARGLLHKPHDRPPGD